MKPTHVSQTQAARILGVTKQAIWKRLKRGTLVAIEFYGETMLPMDQLEGKDMATKGVDNES
jgi:hypothetical protein